MKTRIAIQIMYRNEYDEIGEVMTRFCDPELLGETIREIQEHKSWVIGRTYLTNEYGQEI